VKSERVTRTVPAPPEKAVPAQLPLCVDLDGTLIRTDSLHEAVMLAAPLGLAKAFARLSGGKAPFKRAIYQLAKLEAAHLPYNEELLAYLRAEKAAGRPLFLVTAADSAIAEAVAAELGLFAGVICSDGAQNLRGRHKADALMERFGRGGFAYAGNDATDLEVWAVAGTGVVVSSSPTLIERARRVTAIEADFRPPAPRMMNLVRAVRPHQWAKNLLVFLPILASTEFLDLQGWMRAGLLFLSFCCAASAIYIVNDLIDLNADRSHPRKRSRPFASGQVSVRAGLLASALLGVLATVIAIPLGAAPLVLGYAALSASYSFALKEKALLDVFVLAGLYTMRIIAGGVVSGYMATEWLIGFSIFMFLSLALAKRVAELIGTRARAGGKLSRRAYADQDIPMLQMMGVAAAFVSALVLSLYLQSQAAESLYQRPQCLFAVAVAVLLWFSRVWLKTSRGEMHDDPVVWAVKDRPSQLLGVGVFVAMLLAVGRIG
jgi:4-hydroxybenzoate polyprenyltransferase/phosphoserine phosphatase